MIFSELYSAYYNTVAAILTRVAKGNVSEQELQQIVIDTAFSESVMTIMPSLKSEKWQLLHRDMTSVLHHCPTMPLTTLEKRWLKSIADDPRMKLFNIKVPNLEDVEPLFTHNDYKIYDRYADGDPFEDNTYISHFNLIREAIRTKSPVKITMTSRHGKEIWVRFFPKGFEYSVKDDKIRVLASGCRFHHFNLSRITSCHYFHGNGPWKEQPKAEQVQELTMEITDERNALERVMLHFAHFEKQAERVDDNHYILRIKYYESDETEVVIRVLSFGPYVKIMEPESFVELIKKRLIFQKSCKLR